MGDIAFNLDEAPLLRAWLLILSAGKSVLLIGLPSLCSDRAGLKNLAREISRCYSVRKRGEQLEPLTMQYADIAEWQIELLEPGDSEIEKEFWSKEINFRLTPSLGPWVGPYKRSARHATGQWARERRVSSADAVGEGRSGPPEGPADPVQ